MPFSNPCHIPAILHFAEVIAPHSVLDVGIGMGSYGLLLRQTLDIAQSRVKSSDWRVRIDGVEIFEGYRNPVWEFAYSRVLMGDIRTMLPTLPPYDLVLCNDVLEHFPQAEARTLVRGLLSRHRVLIATTPNREYPQGAWGGNDAETHHSLLNSEDFYGLVASLETGVTTCYVCTAQADLIYPLLLAADRCPKFRAARPMSLPVRIRRKWRQWTRSKT